MKTDSLTRPTVNNTIIEIIDDTIICKIQQNNNRYLAFAFENNLIKALDEFLDPMSDMNNMSPLVMKSQLKYVQYQ